MYVWVLSLIVAGATGVQRRAVFIPNFPKWSTANNKIAIPYTLKYFNPSNSDHRDQLISDINRAEETLPIDFQFVEDNAVDAHATPLLNFTYDTNSTTLERYTPDCSGAHVAGWYLHSPPKRIININLCLGSSVEGTHLTDGTVPHEIGHALGAQHPFDNNYGREDFNTYVVCSTPRPSSNTHGESYGKIDFKSIMWYDDTILVDEEHGGCTGVTGQGNARLAEQGIGWGNVGEGTWFSEGDIAAISDYYNVLAPPPAPPTPAPEGDDGSGLSDTDIGLIAGGSALGFFILVGIICCIRQRRAPKTDDSEVTVSLM